MLLSVTTNESTIDIKQIAFPSDSISIQSLRRLFPELFDDPNAGVTFLRYDEDFETMLVVERKLARRAFQSALGKPRDLIKDPLFFSENDREGLCECYVLYGLATGQHQAEQLIRSFEQVAADQALRLGKAGRA